MLRLDGRRLLHERLLAVEGQDLLGGQALALLPRPVGGVVVVRQVEDVSVVGRVPFRGQAVLMSHRLHPVDHLRRRAAAAAAEGNTHTRVLWVYFSLRKMEMSRWNRRGNHRSGESKRFKEQSRSGGAAFVLCGIQSCGWLCFPLRFVAAGFSRWHRHSTPLTVVCVSAILS